MNQSIELTEYEATIVRLAPDQARGVASAGKGVLDLQLAEGLDHGPEHSGHSGDW